MLTLNHALDKETLDELLGGAALQGCHTLTLLASAKMEEKELVRLFSSLKHVHSLNLQHTLLDNESKALALSELFQTSPCLKELILASNLLCRIDCIFKSFVPRLTVLAIVDNIISPKELHVLIEELQSPNAAITKLQLVRNNINQVEKFASNVPSFHSLLSLEFSGHYIGSASKAFAEALPKSNLIDFALNNAQLGGDAFLQLLADDGRTFRRLGGRLSCSNNQLMQSAASALSRMLCLNALTELDVSHNHLGDKGAQILSTALPKSHLRVLIVSSNKITTPGVSALAKAARHAKSKLVVLDVSFNEFGDVGALALLKTITAPTCRLQRVKHHCNRISGGLCLHLDSALLRANAHKTLLAFRSAQEIRRLGKRSEARWLPSELLRMLACMIM